MSKYLIPRLLKIFFVISPPIVGMLLTPLKQPDSPYGLVVIFAFFVGIPVVVVIGLITSFLFRKNIKSERISILGYAVPAILTWLALLSV